MSIIGVITTNEHYEVKKAFQDIMIEFPLDGYDMLLYTPTIGQLPIERKVTPSDLVASVGDGRLAKECIAMRRDSQFRILLLEGSFSFSKDNYLRIDGVLKRNWTRKGIRNLLRSIRYIEGVDIEWSDNLQDSVQVVEELHEYFKTTKHVSLRVRPPLDTAWIVPTREERLIYFYSGLPGISLVRAKAISGIYKSAIEIFSASVDDLKLVPGIGDKLSQDIYDFLRGLGKWA